ARRPASTASCCGPSRWPGAATGSVRCSCTGSRRRMRPGRPRPPAPRCRPPPPRPRSPPMPDSPEPVQRPSHSEEDDEGVLEPEDAKLVTLARSTRARTFAAEGAAVRDETGRTYTAASVELPSLGLSALRAAVVLAASSGVRSLEAAAVVRDDTDHDL